MSGAMAFFLLGCFVVAVLVVLGGLMVLGLLVLAEVEVMQVVVLLGLQLLLGFDFLSLLVLLDVVVVMATGMAPLGVLVRVVPLMVGTTAAGSSGATQSSSIMLMLAAADVDIDTIYCAVQLLCERYMRAKEWNDTASRLTLARPSRQHRY
jgi:hypothetical protein